MKNSKMSYALNLCAYVLKGLTVYRALVYSELKRILPRLGGRVLDIASGGSPAYHGFLSKNVELSTSDIKHVSEKDIIDMNKKLPFDDSSFDHILSVNAIYIVKNPQAFFEECMRVLKPGGTCIVVSPFISNEMPDPDDYRRFTRQGLLALTEAAGFETEKCIKVGERFTSACYLLHPVFIFSLIRLPFVLLSLLLDSLIPASVKKEHPAPLGYIVQAGKPGSDKHSSQ